MTRPTLLGLWGRYANATVTNNSAILNDISSANSMYLLNYTKMEYYNGHSCGREQRKVLNY